MPNASYLTEKYSGLESNLWTPCIYSFFRNHQPRLPVSACIAAPSSNGPWYESRKPAPYLKVVGELLQEPGPDEFLMRIGAAFGLNLINAPGRHTTIGDIAGICPDIVIIGTDPRGVYVVENKPYYHSKFDGNQGAGGAYVACVKWLNDVGVPCEYLVIQCVSWCEYRRVKAIQDTLGQRFGVVFLEDVFHAMAQGDFEYKPIVEDWSLFTEKGGDYA